MTYATTGNASLFLPLTEDIDPDDFADDFGIHLEQPSRRERRAHRSKNDPRAGVTAGGQTNHEQES